MHASMPSFVLVEKWFLMGHEHLKTPIGHFVKWQSHLQKVSFPKPFSKQGIILCGVEIFLTRH